MAEITNPHDRFFKEVFSRPEVAEDFVQHYLPPGVASLLQPNTFQLCKDSFVDSNLTEYLSDLLYRVDVKEGMFGYVYILFEHKSYPAQDIAFQLLRYITRVWERHSGPADGHIPPVIPVVLYHGRAKWRVPPDFASLYHAPESMRDGLLDFTYYLCDLSTYSDSEIKLGAMATLALRLMKNIHNENLPALLRDLFALLRALAQQTALEFLETVLRYLGAAAEAVTIQDCRKAVEATFPETGEMYMDRWTEQLVAERKTEWIREGMKEGMKEGIASLTIRQLTRKFGKLDIALEERVRQLSLEQLGRLGEDLLDLLSESELARWLDRYSESH